MAITPSTAKNAWRSIRYQLEPYEKKALAVEAL